METTQINLRVSKEFLERAKDYAESHGFLTVQEFFREAARDRIFDEAEIRPEYLKKLQSKDANTFLSVEESKALTQEMRRRAKCD